MALSMQFSADDEVCNEASTQWLPASEDVVNYLNKECREPQKVVVTLESVVRLTIITDNFSQGQVCNVGELPTDSNSSLLEYVAPEIDSIANPHLFSQKLSLLWPSCRLRKVTGFVHK